jgi:uncharacterized protein (DUF433 family)
MTNWSTCSAVESDPNLVSGAWVFRGTRISVAALFENLEGGASLDDFVKWFPGTTLAQVEQVFNHAAQKATAADSKISIPAETVVHKLQTMLASAKKAKSHTQPD